MLSETSLRWTLLTSFISDLSIVRSIACRVCLTKQILESCIEYQRAYCWCTYCVPLNIHMGLFFFVLIRLYNSFWSFDENRRSPGDIFHRSSNQIQLFSYKNIILISRCLQIGSHFVSASMCWHLPWLSVTKAQQHKRESWAHLLVI